MGTRKRGNNEGSVYQRLDGRWVGAVSLDNGKRKAYYGKTRSVVAAKVARALHEFQQGITPADDRLTVRAFMSLWLAGRKDVLRYNTHRDYESRFRLYIEPELGSVRLSKLTPERVERLLANMRDNGLSPRTCQYVHAVLRAALDDAVKRGHIARNVAKLVDAPPVKHEPIIPLEVEQARLFLAAASREKLLGPLYVVTLGLGLRKGEVLALRWRDIDLERSQLRISHSLQRQKGKGLVLVEPKSLTSRRPLALPPFVLESFREQRRRQVEQRLAAGSMWYDQDFVFTMPNGNPISGDYINAKFPAFVKRTFSRCPHCDEGHVADGQCDKCGMTAEVTVPKITFHGLRHSCASLLFAQGCSLLLVKEILGHSKIALTADTYTHLLDGANQEAADAMQSILVADS